MIVAAPGGGYRLLRSQLFAGTDSIPPPHIGTTGGASSVAGRRVSVETARGLPAVLRGIRFLAETIATLPLLTIREGPDGSRERALDTWQWQLLHYQPNDTQRSPFSFKAYVIASMIGRGNAYVLKAKSRGRVQGLYPLDPRRVTPRMQAGELVFEVRDGGTTAVLTRADIIHLPGLLLDDPCVGVSPITIVANSLGTSLGVQEHAGRYFDNDATPAGALTIPGPPNTQLAKDLREFWEDRHRGAANAHRLAVLFGGATYQQIGVSAQDAQIIEAQRWTVEESARALGLPAWAVGGVDQNPRSTPEQRGIDLKQFALAPWFTRIEEGLHADDDMFPDKTLQPEFLGDALLRADTAGRYDAYLKGRQAGWLSVNDIRRKENEPPIEGGDEYQTTPVGGAPNLQPGQAPADQGNDQ